MNAPAPGKVCAERTIPFRVDGGEGHLFDGHLHLFFDAAFPLTLAVDLHVEGSAAVFYEIPRTVLALGLAVPGVTVVGDVGIEVDGPDVVLYLNADGRVAAIRAEAADLASFLRLTDSLVKPGSDTESEAVIAELDMFLADARFWVMSR